MAGDIWFVAVFQGRRSKARVTLGASASLSAIAAALTAQGVAKPRGGSAWTATDVKRAWGASKR